MNICGQIEENTFTLRACLLLSKSYLMRRIMLLIYCCIGIWGIAVSQDAYRTVIASDGGTAIAPTMVLDWTLGEPVVESAVSVNCLYTQGFQQAWLDVPEVHPVDNVIKPRTSNTPVAIDVAVRPNPVRSVLTVDLSNVAEQDLDIMLTDLTGVLVLKAYIAAGTSAIDVDVSSLISGMYILTVYGNEQEPLGIFKVSRID